VENLSANTEKAPDAIEEGIENTVVPQIFDTPEQSQDPVALMSEIWNK
jgi:hypothetical protein